MVNQVLPRAGELARCSILLRSDKIPVATSFGTAVVSRILDMVMLFLFLGSVVLLERDTIMAYLGQVTASKSGGPNYTLYIVLAALAALGASVVWIMRTRLLRLNIVQRLVHFMRELIYGAMSIRNLQSPVFFVAASVSVWLLYWANTIIGFYCFAQIAALPTDLVYFGLIVTVMGGLGMAMPVPGGIGPFHQAVIFTFVGFLAPGIISNPEAQAMGQSYAVLMHTSQFVFLILAGAVSYFYLILRPSNDSARVPVAA